VTLRILPATILAVVVALVSVDLVIWWMIVVAT